MGPRPLRRLTLLGLVLLATAALGEEQRDGGAPLPEVHAKQVGDLVVLEGTFDVEAEPAVAWEVLTDYGRMPSFLSGLEQSAVRQRGPGRAQVEQEAMARAWIFHRKVRVLLEIEETPLQQLRFHDVSKRDFEQYEGSWTLRPVPGALRIEYRLRATPKLHLPGSLGRDASRDTARQLLHEVQSEIHKRQEQRARAVQPK